MRKRKSFNWFALFMFVVLVYFGTVLVSQQVHLAHVGESQYMADKRLVSPTPCTTSAPC